MDKIYNFLILFIFIGITVQAQNVGIGTNSPDASAKLHIEDPNRGILVPQVSISNVSLSSPVTSPATGLLVWNTNAGAIGGSGQGFYFWNGAMWMVLGSGGHNTLDMAYDEGGIGAGRVITADAGTIEINGTGGLMIDANTTSLSSGVQVNNTNGTNNVDIELGYVGNIGVRCYCSGC